MYCAYNLLMLRIFLISFSFLLFLLPVSAHACSNPTGVEAEIIYNTDHKVMQFCNGTNWISMAVSDATLASLADIDDVQDGISPTEGQFLTWDNTGGEWIAADGVSGFKIPDDASVCDGSTDGTIRYNSNKLQLCVNGTGWTSLVGGSINNGNWSGGRLWGDYVLNTDYFWIGLDGTGPDVEKIAIGIEGDHATSGLVRALHFRTNYNTRMLIDENGNVGIGTTGPTTTLHLRGANPGGVMVEDTGSDGASVFLRTSVRQWNLSNDSTGNFQIYDDTAAETRLLVNSSGNVGIGTASPADKLHVEGAVRASFFGIVRPDDAGNWAEVDFRSGYNVADEGYWNLAVDGSTGKFHIRNFNDARSTQNLPMTFQENGNVGIGTVSPAGRLHVKGGVQIGDTDGTQGSLVLHGSAANTHSRLTTTAGNLHIDAGYGVGAGGDSIYLNFFNGGTVFVGRPSIKPANLVVNGTGTTCAIGSGTGNTACTSDERLKDRINTVANGLDKITKLRGVTFHWKDPAKSESEKLGVIAQEVEDVFPQLVETVEDPELGEAKVVNIAGLVAPLIEAVKKLKAENDNLRERIEALESASQ